MNQPPHFIGRPVVLGRQAAVSSGHHLASDAGMQMLRAGGTAVDAAVATCAALAVLKPDACALGSDLFVQYYDAKTSRVYALNASGPAAALAEREAYADGIPAHGPRSALVPGAVGGWIAALERFGRLDRARVLAPAIELAAQGMPVSVHLAGVLESDEALLRADPGCAAVFFANRTRPRYGDVLRQPDLAVTLGAIAREGAQGFYSGAFARALDADSRANGGLLRAGDLAAYEPIWREPVRTTYRGFEIVEQPPVSLGFLVLEALKLIEGFDIAAMGDRSADFVHLHAEAMKLALADRERYLGDPDRVAFDPSLLLDDRLIAERRGAIDMHRANPSPAAAELLQTASDTSFMCALDAEGNAVSAIQSVFHVWGSAWLVPGTGTLMNDRMHGFALDPGHPNVLAPGKRPMHTLNTVVVLENGRCRWVLGTPGGPGQVHTNAQLLTRAIDAGLDPQAAIEAPRSYTNDGKLRIESRYGAEVLHELAARGHAIDELGAWSHLAGGAEMIELLPSGVRAAGADPRREGYALAM